MARTKKEKEVAFRKKLVEDMLKLSTSGFGLVAALAWNDLIKELISSYIEPFIGKDSGIISMTVYAVIVTVLAVTVTYNLARIKDRL